MGVERGEGLVDGAFYWVRPKYEDGTECGWTVAEWGEHGHLRDASGAFSVLRWLNHFRPQDLAEIGPYLGKGPARRRRKVAHA
jgi:hypothetical protein